MWLNPTRNGNDMNTQMAKIKQINQLKWLNRTTTSNTDMYMLWKYHENKTNNSLPFNY